MGHVVFAVELDLIEDPQEDVLGKDVLEQHFPHVGLGDVGADAAAAEGEEFVGLDAVVLAALFGDGDGLAEVFQHRGQVGLELDLGLAELLDVGQFVVEEAADEAVHSPGRDMSTRRATPPFWTSTAVSESSKTMLSVG